MTTDSNLSQERSRTVLLRISAFYSAVSLTIAVLLWFIRRPLGGPDAAAFFYYWAQASALMTTVWLAGCRPALPYPGVFLSVLVLSIGVQFVAPLAWLPWAVLALLSLLAAVAVARSMRIWPALAAGMAAVLLGVAYFFHVNSFVYGNVFSPESTLAGVSYPDPLFHASIASIAVAYGKIASALDGLHAFRYHIFSHLWLGLDAKAAGIDTLSGYVIGKQVVGVPLLLFGLTFAALGFMPQRAGVPKLGLLLVVPIAVLFVVDRFDAMSYLVSESHLFGILLFLIGLPYLRAFANEQSVLGVIVVGLYAVFLSATKISVGAVWTVAILYLVATSDRRSLRTFSALLVALVVQAYVVLIYTLPSDNVGTTGFGLFHFLLTYPKWAAANLVIIAAAAAFHLRELRGEERRWSGAVLLMMASAVAPAMLLRIEGGSAYYFLNIGTWIGIASVASRIIAWASDRQVMGIAASVAVIVSSWIWYPEKAASYARVKTQRDALYARLNPESGSGISASGLFDQAALRELAAKSAASTGAKIGRLLEQVGATPGSNVLVAVAPEFSSFWKLTSYCEVAPFLIPAAFGLPLLMGLPPRAEKCDLGVYYGYALYGPESHAGDVTDDAATCQLVRQRGFSAAVILRSDHDARRLACDAQ